MIRSIFVDMRDLAFYPRTFFQNKFMSMSQKRIYVLGYIGVLLGLILSSIFSWYFCAMIQSDLTLNSERYQLVLSNLQITNKEFLELIKNQQASALLFFLVSPALAYVAPHLFGGALYLFLKIFIIKPDLKLEFGKILECAAISLYSMIYYFIPIIGPLLVPIMMAMNLSRALSMYYKLYGFMKIASIVFALYLCFYLISTTMFLLAINFIS